jgi:cellulose synthase/poly-beta-1,6-N-acetylglucosamine synthase-like glycosyltransferase
LLLLLPLLRTVTVLFVVIVLLLESLLPLLLPLATLAVLRPHVSSVVPLLLLLLLLDVASVCSAVTAFSMASANSGSARNGNASYRKSNELSSPTQCNWRIQQMRRMLSYRSAAQLRHARFERTQTTSLVVTLATAQVVAALTFQSRNSA